MKKVNTKSASATIQVDVNRGYRVKVIKHLGSSKNGDEMSNLHQAEFDSVLPTFNKAEIINFFIVINCKENTYW